MLSLQAIRKEQMMLISPRWVLLTVIICLAGFLLVAEAVVWNTPLVTLDNTLANGLHTGATPLATAFFRIVTMFGLEVADALMIVVVAYFILRRWWLHVLILLVTYFGGIGLNLTLKGYYARPRPFFADPIDTAGWYSFPSGHAMRAFFVYGLLAYFIILHNPGRRLRWGVVAVSSVVIVLVGLSRMYLGVHYFSDVIGAFLAGGVWLGLCIGLFNFLKQRFSPAVADTTS